MRTVVSVSFSSNKWNPKWQQRWVGIIRPKSLGSYLLLFSGIIIVIILTVEHTLCDEHSIDRRVRYDEVK